MGTTAAPPASLSLRDVDFSYGERKVLGGVTLSLEPGKTTGLLGRNGSGKSTLHGLLCGLLPWQGGRLTADGRPISPTDPAFRAVTGVVFQKNCLDLKLTPEQNLRLAGELFGMPRAARKQRAETLLALAGLSDRAGERTADLSGGMQRRLDLMRALMHAPRWLLLDEPTAGLDEVAFREVWAFLESLQLKEGLGVLVVTHRPDEAERCHRIHFLQDGAFVASGSPAELRARVGDSVVEVRPSHLGDVFLKITGAKL